MATSWTYNSLVSELKDWVEDDSSEFDAALADIIKLAEDKVLKDLDSELFTKTDTGSFSVGTETITKPSDLVALKTLYYTASGSIVYLEQRSFDFLIDYAPDPTDTGDPKYYCELDEDTWRLAKTPGTAHTWTARYIYRPAALASGNQNTWLATNAGEALFFACLMQSERYLKDDDRKKEFERDYLQALAATRHEQRHTLNRDYDPLNEAAMADDSEADA